MKFTSLLRHLLPIAGAVAFWGSASAEKLVILHTNDTHSSIDPLPDGTSGVLQRKAIMDSVRNVEKNVLTIDAGDAVQGTLYFKYFHGDVEYPLMNMSGYDIRILGNHEFDNGMESLASYYKDVKGIPLSANYDFTGTALEGIFKPYTVKEYDGKKIGIVGINISPESIIAHKNIEVNFKDVIDTANTIASQLKKEEGCEMVIVVSHIGYDKINDKPTDIDLAEQSSDIDLIIGGHTHTLIDPNHPEINPSLLKNKNGRNVRVVQTGKQGKYIGKLSVDLNQLPLAGGEIIEYELIPVTDRFPECQLDKEMMAFLKPFRESVDSVNNVVIAYSANNLRKGRTGGLPNLTADIAYEVGKEIVDSLRREHPELPDLDMAIMNVGGIRHDMPKGPITEGQILSTYPFSNLFTIIKVNGQSLIDAMKVSASKGGEAVSGNTKVVTDGEGTLKNIIINGKPVDPERDYIIATIDYIAEGNDDLVSLANHDTIWISEYEVAVPILNWIKKQHAFGLKVDPDPRSRFVAATADTE